MNVLSLFDGISCGKVALERAGVDVGRYYASEIDERAMAVSRANHPDIIQLGEVSTICPHSLPRIDILLAGSPCQGFSCNGKQGGFDDPRSKLFWEFVRILRAVKPAFFLLENVTMKKEWRDIITKAVGVEPVFINSSCLSAQSRPRWYWSDLPRVVLPPPDLGLTLADILEKPAAVSQPMRTKTGKAYCLTATYGNCGSKGVPYPSEIAHNLERHQRTCIIGRAGKNNYGQAERVYSMKSVSPTLLTTYPPKIGVAAYSGEKPKPSPCPHLSKLPVIEEHAWRMLTPVECERLQTLDDGYTACLSDKQRYKAIGNGWTVDVIAYLLGGIP